MLQKTAGLHSSQTRYYERYGVRLRAVDFKLNRNSTLYIPNTKVLSIDTGMLRGEVKVL